MKDVIKESVRLLQKKEPCVVATVVKTRGMTPQKAGAKQLFRQDGTSVGTLGGGCVEGDIWYYAKQMLKQKSGPEYREYQLNEDLAAKDGLVCGGTMCFFLEPVFDEQKILPFSLEIAQACETGPAVTLATVVNSRSKGRPAAGQRALVREDGSMLGGIGDALLEKQILALSAKLASVGGNRIIENENATIYLEGFTTPPTLIILGGGHVGFAVYRLALTLGFKVIVIDDRTEFSNKERFPEADTIADSYDNALANLDINLNTYILIATRGHRFDDLATRAAVATPARYVGLLGSKRKNLLIFRELLKDGVPAERIEQIHAPVGLDIGALTPEELAVSILAEIIKCQRGGQGGSLKLKKEELNGFFEKDKI